MRLDLLSAVHFDAVMDLFCRVFQEDAFFEKLLPDSSTRQADMRTYCSAPIACCLQGGTSLGVWEEEKLLGFVLCFDYEEVRKQPDLMVSTFGSDEPGSRFPRMNDLLRRIDTVGKEILYLLFIAVDADR